MCGEPTWDGKLTELSTMVAYKEHHVFDSTTGLIVPLYKTNENKNVVRTLEEQGMVPGSANIIDDGHVLNVSGDVPEGSTMRQGVVAHINDYIRDADNRQMEEITPEEVAMNPEKVRKVSQFTNQTWMELNHPESWKKVLEAKDDDEEKSAVQSHHDAEQEALNKIKAWIAEQRYCQRAIEKIEGMEEENKNFRQRIADNG